MFRRWFDLTLDPDHHTHDTDGLYRLFVTAALAIIVVFAATVWLGTWGEPGQLGDFFGGFLNPILTFITFMGVLATILLQHRELKETRGELAKSAEALATQNDISGRQLFESSFFQMLSLHNSIVTSIDLNLGDSKQRHGRDCFNNFLSHLQRAYFSKKREMSGSDEIDIITEAYNEYWSRKNTELGHYYRHLFNITRYIIAHRYFQPYHGKMLRSQLSDQELVLLYYNSLTTRGAAFKDLAKKIDLFDNLPKEMLLDPSHIKWLSDF